MGFAEPAPCSKSPSGARSGRAFFWPARSNRARARWRSTSGRHLARAGDPACLPARAFAAH
eukprot:10190571-Lingulodinium_polyedra.AAC.1